MIKVYVAGAISNPDSLKFLDNIRKGQRASTELLLKGYAPFCPFLDYQFFLQLRDSEKITIEQIQAYSRVFLEVCNAVLVLPNWQGSLGTQKEIQHATHLGIPVFYDIKSLKQHFGEV